MIYVWWLNFESSGLFAEPVREGVLGVLNAALFGLHSVLFLLDGDQDLIIKRLLLLPVIVLNLGHELLERLEARLAFHFFHESDVPGCLIRFIVRVCHRPPVRDKLLIQLRLGR